MIRKTISPQFNCDFVYILYFLSIKVFSSIREYFSVIIVGDHVHVRPSASQNDSLFLVRICFSASCVTSPAKQCMPWPENMDNCILFFTFQMISPIGGSISE